MKGLLVLIGLAAIAFGYWQHLPFVWIAGGLLAGACTDIPWFGTDTKKD